jgi:SAM-dependent methyltransferase
MCGSSKGTVIANGKDYLHKTSDQTYQFFECAECQHLYLNPRPKLEEISRLYPSDYVTFTEAFKGEQNFLAKIKDAVLVRRFKSLGETLPKDMKLLDVGCGDAQFLLALRRQFPDAQLDGLDRHFTPTLSDQLRAERIGTIQGIIETAALAENEYDVITMNQLIEHVWDVNLVLERTRRALKPGGVLAIETPNRQGWDRRFFKGGAWGGYYWPRHLNLFSRPHLAQFAKAKGMRVVQSVRLLAPPCWILSFRFTLQRAGFNRTAKLFPDTSIALLACFAVIDTIAAMAGAETSNQKLILKKV